MAELRVKGTGTLKLFESDNTSSVTIASPASLGADRTITLPDGDVTLSTGTMPVLTGSTNNQVTTVTGADAIQGETNFIYDGTIVGAGADGANADLGIGLHIKNSDTGASVSSSADSLVLEENADMGMTLLGATSGECNINFGDSGTNNKGQIQYKNNNNFMAFTTNTSERARFLSTGTFDMNVGGGTVNANVWTMKVRQNTSDVDQFYLMAFAKADDSTVGSIQSDGTNASFNTSSDYRLKENVVDLTDAIDRVKTLKPKRFNFKDNPSKTRDGFLAHEVTAVPEAVNGTKDATETYTDDEGDEQTKILPQQLDQSKLVPLLTSALQEAITKIETLEAKVTALENA